MKNVLWLLMYCVSIWGGDTTLASSLAQGGIALEAKGQVEAAKKLFASAILNDENCYEALMGLGRISEREGLKSDASVFYKQAAKKSEGERRSRAEAALRLVNPFEKRLNDEITAYAASVQAVAKRCPTVATDALEKLDRVAAAAGIDTKPAGTWLVIFRADDAAVWNAPQNSARGYMADLSSVPDNIKYLKLSRMDTGECVIIPITKDGLRKDASAAPTGWWGLNDSKWGSYHLGVYDNRLHMANGDIAITSTPNATIPGSGFGHKAGSGGKTYFSWNGVEIKKLCFEIAVKISELDSSEISSRIK